VGRVLVGIVAVEGAVAYQKRADLDHDLVHGRIGPEVVDHPRRVTTRPGDEAVQ